MPDGCGRGRPHDCRPGGQRYEPSSSSFSDDYQTLSVLLSALAYKRKIRPHAGRTHPAGCCPAKEMITIKIFVLSKLILVLPESRVGLPKGPSGR